ncbi:hypothetical protein [Anaeromusa sp.]|uniref:hypothetical protein n=1 Tax=Anaeromusa sp. TaxID=1872520 RepID=UPI00262F2503|nr:hypothetical protein [Anaeromusa sp.]MDD3158415.1 hypothetical protein [Anaeromusa sp.]
MDDWRKLLLKIALFIAAPFILGFAAYECYLDGLVYGEYVFGGLAAVAALAVAGVAYLLKDGISIN